MGRLMTPGGVLVDGEKIEHSVSFLNISFLKLK